MTINLDTLRTLVENAGEAWADGEHIDIITPPVVLALLSRVEKAESSCRLLGTIIERDGKNLVELTNSQDIIPEDGDGDWEVVWERAHEMKARLEQAEQAVARVRRLHKKLPYRVGARNTGIPEFVCEACHGEAWGAVEYPCATIRALDDDGRG